MHEKLLKNILFAIDSLIVVIDKNHRIVLSNWKDHEWTPEEIRNRKPHCYKVFKDFDQPCDSCAAMKTFEDGKTRFYEDQNPIDKSCKEISVIPIFNDENAVEYVLENVRDVTKQKQSKEERKKLQAQLIQASKMESIGRLAGGIAHDFNNMLSVILGRAEMAMSQVLPNTPVYNDLEEILQSGHRSAGLVRQLLAFARQQTTSPVKLNLNRTVSGMLYMLRRVIGDNIKLVWKPDKEIYPIKIDPSQIDQVLVNLCINSRDAISGEGKITITTGTASLDDAYCKANIGATPGEYTTIAVTDNGEGIDEEILQNIFDPFFTTKAGDKGTGLGLATVYGIVKQNSGFITVHSQKEEGASFEIFFPKAGGNIAAERSANAEKSLGGSETILVVENNGSVLKLIEHVLKRFGYNVLTADMPSKALDIFKQPDTKVDLMILDLVMPEMDGKELSSRIKKKNPNIKTLLMSGYSPNITADHGVIEKDVEFLQKPFSNQALSIKIREILDG